MDKKTEQLNLKSRLISEDNIFKAIYSLDSYVFERGLLNEDDIKLLYQLRDCHNAPLISNIIEHCQKKLNEMMDDKHGLFNIEIYFKFKSKEKNVIKYRPIHSTSLENLICMVAMLRLIMFDEKEDKVFLSGLCKLIPHNFYGNLPSTRAESLFIPWRLQYKQYSEHLLQRYKNLTETKEYTQEVCLDLKDFFPSVSPYWIYQYTFEKLKSVWSDPCDIDCLKQILCKLLFFKVRNDDMDSWKTVYYYDMSIESQQTYYNRGIAQGLPQSYFFGNLAMIEIAKLIDIAFPGDSYYYVDDSVIYTNDIDEKSFGDKIDKVNSDISKRFEVSEDFINKVNSLLGDETASFQQKLLLSYTVKLHTEDKSFYSEIKEKNGTHGGILPLMAKEVSIAGNLFDNMDDYDDEMSLSKINALLEIIDFYLLKYKSNNNNEKRQNCNDKNNQSKVKMLKRYRKFFLFRKKLILLKTENGGIKELADDLKNVLSDTTRTNQLLENFDQEVFKVEVQLLLENCSTQIANDLIKHVADFEKNLNSDNQNSHLYFYTTFIAVELIQKCRNNYTAYDSLRSIMSSSEPAQMASESKKLKTLQQVFSSDNIIKEIYPQLPDYAKNVCVCSDEFKRKILNAYLSKVLDAELSDMFNIYKKNCFHSLRYFDLRVLAFVRNKNFRMDDFSTFLLSLIKSEQPSSFTGIDANLLSVLGLFVHKVRNPRHVDSLICTHQLVSGLWMNGSKFMHQYTLHNQDHAITLIRLSLKLIKHIDYLGLKQNDFFVLFLACYLHDVSMVINPQLKMFNKTPSESDIVLTKCLIELHRISADERRSDLSTWKDMLLTIFSRVYDYFENAKRKVHADESANFILSHADNFFSYIEPTVLQMVANVGASHGYDAVEVYGRRSEAKKELFSMKYMMILIRLADVMDITSERVNFYLLKENFHHLSELSKFHWVSHYITNSVEPFSHYEFVKDNVRINEKISIIMELNTNNLMPFTKKKMNCSGCNMEIKKEDVATTKELILSIEDNGCSCTYSKLNNTECPLLCVWMRKKHEYLFEELVELKKYINWVNLPLFTTKIEVVVKLAENDKLDSEFFDATLAYLEQ